MAISCLNPSTSPSKSEAVVFHSCLERSVQHLLSVVCVEVCFACCGHQLFCCWCDTAQFLSCFLFKVLCEFCPLPTSGDHKGCWDTSTHWHLVIGLVLLQVLFGTADGQVIVMDCHGRMLAHVLLHESDGILSMSWNYPIFLVEDSSESDTDSDDYSPPQGSRLLALTFLVTE